MARIVDFESSLKEICKALARAFQSGNVNVLLGSGASAPAIAPGGTIEREVAALLQSGKEDEGRRHLYDFLAAVQAPTNKLILDEADENNAAVLKNYKDLLATLERILAERRTTLLPKQATIFTTNYDLFIEKACVSVASLKLNDGFARVPSLNNRMEFSSRAFFDATYNTGNLYNYRVEIPCVNLIKLHGSLSWLKDGEAIIFRVAKKDMLAEPKHADQVKKWLEDHAVVLPQAQKFHTTLMDRTYYELLRIFANALDRENTLLLAFGFSFADEHILDITKRALRNPTLRLTVIAFDGAAKTDYATRFEAFNNVEIVAASNGKQLTFEAFNDLLRSVLPKLHESV